MEKRIKAYTAYAEALAQQALTPQQRAEYAQQMLVQIGFFQHERLIHLIVTVTFALLLVVCAAGCVLAPGWQLVTLTALLLALVVPYIRHYYILENSVQRLYALYDTVSGNGFTAP